MIVSRLLHSRLFMVGLAARLLLVIFAQPLIQDRYVLPFIETTVRHAAIDPWTTFLTTGGGWISFSDTPTTLVLLLPLTALGMAVDALLNTAIVFSGLGFRTTLLLLDVIGLVLALHIFARREKVVTVVYWLSPLSVYVTYWHGQTEIVSVVLMMAAFTALKRYKMHWTGTWLGLATAANLAMAIVVPFFLIHLWQNKRLRDTLPKFLFSLVITLLIALLPWILFSPGFQITILGAIGSAELFGFVLPLSGSLKIYLFPLTYFLIMYAMWRLKRTNFEVLVALIGVFLIILVLTTRALPSWYLWMLPFMVAYATQTTRIGIGIVHLFMLLVVLMLFPVTSGARFHFADIYLPFDHVASITTHTTSLCMTLVATVALILAMRMYGEGVYYNPYFRFSRRPLVVGVAGDSGTGKDTFAVVIRDLFGRHSVSTIFGDAYHKWDRSAPMWRAVTHLNPKANDLSAMTHDTISVITGGTVFKRHYDHRIGRFLRPTPIKPNDVVLVVGLHALFNTQLREKLDVKIFLDTDELLRLHWKVLRDTSLRGQAVEKLMATIEARRADANAYISPQLQYADLVFTLMPVNPEHVNPPGAQLKIVPLKLRVRMRDALYCEALIKTLIGVCGLLIDWDIIEEGSIVDLTVEGEVCADDICLATTNLVPGLNELLDISPIWKDDMLGVMQLITLLQIDQTLRKRILE